MNAIVSGRSGRALIIDGETLKSVEIDDPSTFVPRKRSDLPYLFGDASDLRLVENATTESIVSTLTAECNSTLALDLTLISLDAELEVDIRKEALEGLEELFADRNTFEHVEHVMYSHPVPDDGDLDGALDICPSDLELVSEFLRTLKTRQSSIADVDEAWEAIPTRIFDGHENRKVFRRTAVQEGLFHALATIESPASLSTFLLNANLNQSIKQLPNYRQVIQAWVAPFKQSRETPTIVQEEDNDTFAEPERFGRRGHRVDRKAVLREAQRKKSVIVAAMRRRDLVRVNELVDDLVAFHQSYSESQHTAKSLCDLAMEAKALEMSSLQLTLTERSINIAPGDSWSWTQHADALLKMQRLDEALQSSDQAMVFGGDLVAQTGRADILRARGRLDEALVIYENVISEDPQDAVAKAGRAEVLKAQGQFEAALAAYKEIIAQHPDDVVPKTGRAEVLKVQGKFEASLAAYNEVITQHPEDVVARTGRAEVFKVRGQFDAALAAYERVIRQHPENVVAKNGRAEVLKAQGQFEAALAAYEEVIKQYPESAIARNGRSCVLVALYRYQEALDSLPTAAPVGIEDWIAYHIRGMILLRLGRLTEAMAVFNDGVTNTPFASEKEYFREALALSWIRGRDFRKAAQALEAVTSPALQPSANVIRIHVFGAQGQRGRAVQAYENLAATPHLLNDELTQELHHQYVLGAQPTKDDEWVFDREVRIFLRAA